MAITSVVCDISMQRLILRYGVSYQRIHLFRSRTREMGRYRGNHFGIKIAINSDEKVHEILLRQKCIEILIETFSENFMIFW